MKFELSDFMELDTKALLAVNGGSDCSKSGGYSPSPSPSAGGASTPTGGEGSGLGSGGGASGGGYCSGASDGKTIYANSYYKGGEKNSCSPGNVGGNCSRTDLDYWHTEYEKKVQECDMEMKKSIDNNIADKKYTDDYMCDNWVAEVLEDAGHDVNYYFNGDADDTVQNHIDGLKENSYSKEVPAQAGVYVVFMNDGHKSPNGNQYIPHAGILVVSETGKMTMYDNSSRNSNGGVESTVVSKTSDTTISAYGYDSYYFQKVTYAH